MAILLCFGATQAQAEFGFEHADLTFLDASGSPAMQAGSHPYAVKVELSPKTEMDSELGEIPAGQPRELAIWLAPGLVGSPYAAPRCSYDDFLAPVSFLEGALVLPDCSDAAAVGLVRLRVGIGSEQVDLTTPVYNLAPSPGELARLGFRATPATPMTVELSLSESPPHELAAGVFNITRLESFFRADMTLWGVPTATQHDDDRGVCGASIAGEGGSEDLGDLLGISCPALVPPRALITLPRSCTGPLATLFEAESWLDEYTSAIALTGDGAEPPHPIGVGGCDVLAFDPAIELAPTTLEAGSPSGLDLDLSFFDAGLTNPDGIAGSDLAEIEVALPAETALHSAALAALETCSEADFALETSGSALGDGCPAASKIGSIEVETPLLEGVVLHGSLFLGEPYAEPFDTLFMTIKEPQRGIEIDVLGEVERDPVDGGLIVVFYDLPQLPFDSFHLAQDPPLFVTPLCGDYEIETFLTPSSNPGVSYRIASPFKLEHGPGGGPCPSGAAQSTPKQKEPPLNPPVNDPQPQPSCGAHAGKAKRLARRAKRLRSAARRARAPRRRTGLRRKSRRLAKRARRQSRMAKRCRARISRKEG